MRSRKKGHRDFVLVLTDLSRRIVLDVLPDRQKRTLIAWLRRPPDGIDLSHLAYAATDLWSHYRAAVHTVLPDVAVVADRFHVVQNLHAVIYKVRREAQKNAADDDERAELKGLRYLLLKNEHNLTDSDKARLTKLANAQPLLHRLWWLRQDLHDWYETDTTPDQTQLTLDAWIADARQLGLKHLNAFCDTLTAWRTEIVNFFHHRITSGFVEGMNSKIRGLKRIAFGIPNFEHFRLRVIAFRG
jgi:transposase